MSQCCSSALQREPPGEGFFARLQELRPTRARRRAARLLQCLLLGFQGKYAVRAAISSSMRLIDSLRPEVERQIEAPDPLAPAGLAPDTAELQRGRHNPLLWVALAVWRARHRRLHRLRGVARQGVSTSPIASVS